MCIASTWARSSSRGKFHYFHGVEGDTASAELVQLCTGELLAIADLEEVATGSPGAAHCCSRCLKLLEEKTPTSEELDGSAGDALEPQLARDPVKVKLGDLVVAHYLVGGPRLQAAQAYVTKVEQQEDGGYPVLSVRCAPVPGGRGRVELEGLRFSLKPQVNLRGGSSNCWNLGGKAISTQKA